MTPDTASQSHLVYANELPICCPRPTMALWNKHPRVYLDLKENGQATCPYCSCHYVLVDVSTTASHD